MGHSAQQSRSVPSDACQIAVLRRATRSRTFCHSGCCPRSVPSFAFVYNSELVLHQIALKRSLRPWSTLSLNRLCSLHLLSYHHVLLHLRTTIGASLKRSDYPVCRPRYSHHLLCLTLSVRDSSLSNLQQPASLLRNYVFANSY